MELIYLWIYDYKNIKKQGFNFSPIWRFDFDGDDAIDITVKNAGIGNDFFTNKETISVRYNNENKEAIKTVRQRTHGSILNVTAIVGECYSPIRNRT